MPNLKKSIFFFLVFPLVCLAQLSEAQKTLSSLYDLIVKISGGCALLMLVLGGFEYMTSAGDIGRVKAAKERIYSAILGLLIVLCSQMILKIISPRLR